MKRSKLSSSLPSMASLAVSDSEDMRRVRSFGELNSHLLMSMQCGAAERLKKENVMSHSSAMKNPNNPIIRYEIDDESEFNAAEAFDLLLTNKIHGIPVWIRKKNRFVGTLELKQIAQSLSTSKDVTNGKRDVKLWKKTLKQPHFSSKLLADVMSGPPVFTVKDSASLFDVVQRLRAHSIQRVIVVDETGEAVAVVAESDLVTFFQQHPSCFTFKDGSEIPVSAHEVADPESSGKISRVSPSDTFSKAIQILLKCDVYSIPIISSDGKFLNTFTQTDLKRFFYEFDQSFNLLWNCPLLTFLEQCCGKKSSAHSELFAATLGVPLTRVVQIMNHDRCHVVWVCDTFGWPIGELTVSDICAYITADTVPKATRRDLPDLSEEVELEMHLSPPDVISLERLNKQLSVPDHLSPRTFSDAEMPSSPITRRKRSFATGEELERKSSTGSDYAGTRSLDTSGDFPELEDFDEKAIAEKHAVEKLHETQQQKEKKFDSYPRNLEWLESRQVRNKVQLITYPDCFGGNLTGLKTVLHKHFEGVVGGVHVLPFYPSSADRGFSPLTYKEVDPTFGSWEDVESLTDKYDICVDFMVNHISQQSVEFQDFKAKRDESEFSDLFVRYPKFWSKTNGEPSPEDLALIYTRKPRAPYYEVEFTDGKLPKSEKVWCTFDLEQIDIDCFSDAGRTFIRSHLEYICNQGVKFIRLDAFGYATKQPGTKCFMQEPEVWELLQWIGTIVKPFGVELLAEVHEHYTIQMALSRQNDSSYWVYDFALPMLLLQALYDSNVGNLYHWLTICPHNQLTTLDTHDGIGVVDVKDLLTDEESARTCENLYRHGANVKRIYSTSSYSNLDIYQINCTYYSALGNRDDWYLLARAIQLFVPGIPQIYYVGLLAGANDIELVEQTKVGRDINRHNYTLDEVEREVQRPVVKRIFELCRFRNSYPAFNGKFTVGKFESNKSDQLTLRWRNEDGLTADLEINVTKKSFQIYYTDIQTKKRMPFRFAY